MFVEEKKDDKETTLKKDNNKNNDKNEFEEINKTLHNHSEKEKIQDVKTNTSDDVNTNHKQENEHHKTDSKKHYIKFLEEQIQKLEQKLNNVKKENDHNKLKFTADLDNFKKRINKEKNNEIKYSSINFIDKILVPFEQFDKVLENTESQKKEVKNFLIGFKMIHQQIKNIFEEEGLKEIKALGEIFDPHLHYAMEKESDKKSPNNTNIDVFQKGYIYKERILKPAMVKVNEWSEKNGENK